jgi:hypothetical protein
MIRVDPLARRKKEALAAEIAAQIGVEAPPTSTGSSVESLFLDTIHRILFGVASGGADAYRKTENLINRLGLATYDPWWDTSEAQGNGGGTVTTRAYSRILVGLTGRPRCFVVPEPEDRDEREPLRIETSPAGNAFADAGPGSLVLIARQGETVDVIRVARVLGMSPGWQAPWEVQLGDHRALYPPIRISQPRGSRGRIVEVAPATFAAVARAGGLDDWLGEAMDDPGRMEQADAETAARVVESFPLDIASVAPLVVPAAISEGSDPAPLVVPNYIETESSEPNGVDVRVAEGPDPSRRPAGRASAKAAELRAIALAQSALEQGGWTLVRDAQKDGVGYDLLFARDGRRLKVEVKGIIGPALAFNLTPKEWWRAQTDPDWVLVAATSVLSPIPPPPTLVGRERIIAATRVVTGYRLTL